MSAGDSPSTSNEALDPLISQVIAERYRVVRKLGEGGMGAVYLAEHVVIEKKIALKILAPELSRKPELVARFLQEARSASKIEHENVIDISDFGQTEDGCVYIAMEFLDGKDLGESLRKFGAFDWEKTKSIVLQICRALRAAHDKGIVHRDMKPENIFLVHREGQPNFVKILDFGIAKVMGLDPNGPRLTRTGMIFGTPEYMAPEQAEGKDADHRVDVYAVGCILYHLITGQTPFIADSFMTMLTKHLLEDPVAPSVRRPDLPISPEMDSIVLKALEKDRERRWQSMADLIEVLSSCRSLNNAENSKGRSETVPIGGAHSAVAVRAPAGDWDGLKASNREEQYLDGTPVEGRGREVRTRGGRTRLVFIGIGLLLGIGVAAYYLTSGKTEYSGSQKSPDTIPTAPRTEAKVEAKNVPILPQAPSPEPPKQIENTEGATANAAAEQPPLVENPERKKKSDRKAKQEVLGRTAKEKRADSKPEQAKDIATPAVAPKAPTPTPKDLKPFPGM